MIEKNWGIILTEWLWGQNEKTFIFFYSICSSATVPINPSHSFIIIESLHLTCARSFFIYHWKKANACCLHENFPLWFNTKCLFPYVSSSRCHWYRGEIHSIQFFTSESIHVSALHRTAGTQCCNGISVSHVVIPVGASLNDNSKRRTAANPVKCTPQNQQTVHFATSLIRLTIEHFSVLNYLGAWGG